MRLLVEVGTGCAAIMDEKMRELPCKRVQVDEIWSYVGKKQRHLKPEDDRARVGDQWTFVAIDSDTKLIPSYLVGKRTAVCANIFMRDLSMRLANERWAEAVKLGATHLVAQGLAALAARQTAEQDLIGYWNPPLNTHHRTDGRQVGWGKSR